MSKVKLAILGLLAHYSFAANCNETSQTCIDNSAVKYFNGVPFTLAQAGVNCWKYDKAYNCPTIDTCQAYIKNGCIIDQSKNQCTETDASGKCVSWNKTAVCSGGGQSTEYSMIACGNEICKQDASGTQTTCYKADPTQDTDFGAAMSALEVANEMGTMKNCYDRTTGQKCMMADPNDPSKGVNLNCECYFFQGKFITYKDSFNVWDGANCKIGVTATSCDRVAKEYGASSNKLQVNILNSNQNLPQRNIDVWSDKGQLNSSLTGNKDAGGIRAGNQYVYSFASSSKQFDQAGQNLTGNNDAWATKNQQIANYQLNAISQTESIISPDDPNAANNQTHWNTGGNKTEQGSTAQNSGTMKVVQDAAKMVSDVLDFSSAFFQQCSAEDQSKMINVGKHHCLFEYGGVPGPETTQWILYTYGDKNRWNYQDCTYQTTFWGASTACVGGASNYSTCKSFYGVACAACGIGICPDYCKDLDSYCYGQTLGGRGGQDCGGITGGNNIIFKGNANCCFASTISKIITKAAFEQHVGGRPSLNAVSNLVAQFRGIELCSVDDLSSGLCNPSNTGIATQNTFQAMCERGISISEMQKIDFSKIDFTEFFAEANKGINTSGFNTDSATNNNQKNRVSNGVNQQKSKDTNLQNQNYYTF